MAVERTFNARITASDDTGGAFAAITARLQAMSAATQGLNVRMANMRDALGRVRAAVSSVAQVTGLTAIGQAAGNAFGQVRALGGQIAGVAAPLGALGALGTFGGLVGVMHGAVESAGAMEDLINRTGMSARGLAMLRFNAGQTGVEFEGVTASMMKLQDTMANAASGRNALALLAFRNLGISLRDARGQMRSVEDVFADLAARLPTQSAAFQEQYGRVLMGRSGGSLRGFMAEYAANRAEFLRLETLANGGVAVDPSQMEERMRVQRQTLDTLGDTLASLNTQVKGLRDSIGAALAPVLMGHLGHLRDWVAANRNLITSNVRQVITDLVQALSRVDWPAVGREIRDMARSLWGFIERIGGMRTVIIAIGAAIAGPFLMGIGSAIMGIGSLLAVLVANPIGAAIIAGIAAVGGAAYLIYENWDGIRDWFNGLMDGIAEGWRNLVRILHDVWRNFIDPFIEAWNNTLGPIFARANQGRGEGLVTNPEEQERRRFNWRDRGRMPGVYGDSSINLEGGVEVRVRIENAPPGTRAEATGTGVAAQPRLELGYAFGPGGLTP